MKLDVQVCGRTVAQLYRERDEYLLHQLPDPRMSVAVRGLDPAIADAGFSDPEPAEAARVTIGRSELLAAPRRKS